MTISNTIHPNLWNKILKRICIQSSRVFSRGCTTSSVASPIAEETYSNTISKPLPFSKLPGPSGFSKLPYIGPLFLFHPFSDYKPETYGFLVGSLHDKYGPIFKTRLGKGYAVHTSCIEDIDTIFRQEPEYPRRRLNIINFVYRERRGLPQGLGTSNGPEWYALRTVLNAPLNRPKACLQYLPAQNKVTDDLIELLIQKTGQMTAQELFDLFFRFTAESAAVVCFNKRLGFLAQDPIADDTKRLLDATYIHLNSSFKALIGLERKFLKTENDNFYRKYAAALDFIREQSRKYVMETINASREFECDHKFESVDNPDHENKNLLMTLLKESGLGMEHILAIIESLLIAGTDSTARNLSVLFYNFAMHSDIQTRASQEVINILGRDAPITADGLAQMNFLKACVKESMRIYPPISPGPERILSQDTVLSGYHIPEGTSVVMSSIKTSVDPKYFPEPLTFRPDRWLRGEDGKKKSICESAGSNPKIDPRLAALAILPFGHGKRSCVGRRFAEMEIFICAAKVLQKLHVAVDHQYEGLKTIYTPFVTPVKPIPFIFSKR